jgi:hypothetical protein
MRAICDEDQSRTTAAHLEDSNMRARAARARRARSRSAIFERKIIKKKMPKGRRRTSVQIFTRF